MAAGRPAGAIQDSQDQSMRAVEVEMFGVTALIGFVYFS